MTTRRELLGKGNDKQRIEYAEICKAREDIRKYNYHTRNEHGIKEPEEIPKNADARPRQTVTLLEGQSREILELYDSEQNTIIHTDPKEVPEITSWDVEAALRVMKNESATDNEHVNIETLKAEKYIISKTFAKVYTK